MASFSRAVPPSNSGNTVTTTGPTSSTGTVTQGPSTTNTSTSGKENSNSNSSTNTNRTLNGNKTTTGTSTVKTNTTNMDPNSLAALQELIQSLASGGSADDRERWDQIQANINANSLQRDTYSKESAFADATAAANAQTFEALQMSIPAITAGIDAAGTSGSAMSALLQQQAAEASARSGAKLMLEASIGYGNIANQASAQVTELLKIDNPVTNQLLAALDIAKGAVTSSTQTTSSKENSTWQEIVNTLSNTSSSASSSSSSNTTSTNSGGTSTNSTSSPGTTSTVSQGNKVAAPAKPAGGQSLITPSSYTKANINRTGNSFSKFFLLLLCTSILPYTIVIGEDCHRILR